MSPRPPVPARIAAGLAALALLAGCTVGPDYTPPTTPAPEETFARANATSLSIDEEAAPEAAWWSRLGDPTLSDLVDRAREANPDLKAAEANLRRARALLGLERWEQLPSATARASVEESETSGAFLPVGIDRTDTYYSAALDASWEIDLFGRIRRAVEASAASYEASEAERRAVFVAVAGEIGRTYVELRGTQRRLEVARENVGNQEETVALVRALLDAGRGTELDLARAEAQLATTRATVPALERTQARAVHRLAVLVGEEPGALIDLLETPAPLPTVPDRIALGDPASLLRRRPDVEAAERRLAAATAEIGVAVADLFPRVSLSGSFGYLATSLDDLGKAQTRTTSFGPFLQWAAFDLGRVRSRIHAAEAGADARLAAYEKAVLTALEETENALVGLDRARVTHAHLLRAEKAAADAADLADLRYRHGLDSFLAVLDAQSRLLAAQDALARAATDTGTSFVALYEALGGGWEAGVETPPEAPAEETVSAPRAE